MVGLDGRTGGEAVGARVGASAGLTGASAGLTGASVGGTVGSSVGETTGTSVDRQRACLWAQRGLLLDLLVVVVVDTFSFLLLFLVDEISLFFHE